MLLPSIPITPVCLFSSATSNFWMISATYSGVTLVIYAQTKICNLSANTKKEQQCLLSILAGGAACKELHVQLKMCVKLNEVR